MPTAQRFRTTRAYDTETFNVWSHLLAAVWFSFSTSTASRRDVPAVLFLAASAFCFWCSAVFHASAGRPRAAAWQFLDHVGIVAIVWSSAVSFVLLSFARQEALRTGYVFFLSLAGVLCLVRLCRVHFYLPEKRRGRIVAHACYGALAALPALHCCGWSDRNPGLLRAFCLLAVANCIGGGVYATKLLDRTLAFPSGASHNFMHVTAVAGACLYQHGLLWEALGSTPGDGELPFGPGR